LVFLGLVQRKKGRGDGEPKLSTPVLAGGRGPPGGGARWGKKQTHAGFFLFFKDPGGAFLWGKRARWGPVWGPLFWRFFFFFVVGWENLWRAYFLPAGGGKHYGSPPADGGGDWVGRKKPVVLAPWGRGGGGGGPLTFVLRSFMGGTGGGAPNAGHGPTPGAVWQGARGVEVFWGGPPILGGGPGKPFSVSPGHHFARLPSGGGGGGPVLGVTFFRPIVLFQKKKKTSVFVHGRVLWRRGGRLVGEIRVPGRALSTGILRWVSLWGGGGPNRDPRWFFFGGGNPDQNFVFRATTREGDSGPDPEGPLRVFFFQPRKSQGHKGGGGSFV